MIVDSHLHVIGSDSQRYPFQPLRGGPPTRFGPAEELLGLADAAGVARIVAVQSQFYGYDHSYMLDAIRRFPGRFAGVCIIPPRKPDGPADLERRVREEGFRGLRLNPAAQEDGAWLLDEMTFPLWHKAAELGVAIGLLMKPHHAPAIGQVAERFPEVSIVLDHFGSPNMAEGVDGPGYRGIIGLAQHPNVSIKVSGFTHFSVVPFPYEDMVPYVHRAVGAFGPQRCMWGTDYPNLHELGDYAKSLAFIQQATDFLSEEERSWVIGKTALKVWWPS